MDSPGRVDLRRLQHMATTKPAIGAESAGVGKVAEKIALSLPGFPVDPADCRALFEPIDYVVFRGLARQGVIDSLLFVDVKTGNRKLEDHQCQIRDLVQAGKVSLNIVQRAEARP
jgi:predicted Holliday junction resolvase-like endonuclease